MSEETPVFVRNITQPHDGFSIDFFKTRTLDGKEKFRAEISDTLYIEAKNPMFTITLPDWAKDSEFDPVVSINILDFLINTFGGRQPKDPDGESEANNQWWLGDRRAQFVDWLHRALDFRKSKTPSAGS